MLSEQHTLNPKRGHNDERAHNQTGLTSIASQNICGPLEERKHQEECGMLTECLRFSRKTASAIRLQSAETLIPSSIRCAPPWVGLTPNQTSAYLERRIDR